MHLRKFQLISFPISLVFSFLVLSGCKPKLTNKVIIELSSDKALNDFDSIANSTYTTADYQQDIRNTISILKNRLDDVGLLYSEEQIIAHEGNMNRYTILLPEEIKWDKVKTLLTKTGKMEIWKVLSLEDCNWCADIFSNNFLANKIVNPGYEYHADGVLGLVNIKDTIGVVDTLKNMIRNEAIQFRWGNIPNQADANKVTLYLLKKKSRDVGPLITSEYIKTAYPEEGYDETNYVVSLQMNKEGANKWAKITEENIGKSLAIVVDNQVYSVPRVHSKIEGGWSSISGNMSKGEAEMLAVNMQWGELPLKVKVIAGP